MQFKLVVVGATTERTEESVEVYGTLLKQVQQFKYLGCKIHGNGKVKSEVRTRVGTAKATMTK